MIGETNFGNIILNNLGRANEVGYWSYMFSNIKGGTCGPTFPTPSPDDAFQKDFSRFGNQQIWDLCISVVPRIVVKSWKM